MIPFFIFFAYTLAAFLVLFEKMTWQKKIMLAFFKLAAGGTITFLFMLGSVIPWTMVVLGNVFTGSEYMIGEDFISSFINLFGVFSMLAVVFTAAVHLMLERYIRKEEDLFVKIPKK